MGRPAAGLTGAPRKAFGKKPSPFAAGGFAPSKPAPQPLSPKAMAFLEADRGRSAAGAIFDREDASLETLARSAMRKSGATFNPGGKPVFGRRIIALFIDDMLVWLAVTFLFGGSLLAAAATYAASPEGSAEQATAMMQLFIFTLTYVILRTAYSILMESSSLQATVGKLLCGAVVVSRTQERASLGAIVLRNTAGRLVVNMIPFGIGYLMGLFSRERICLHDLMSSTMVRARNGAGLSTAQAGAFD
ncbi:RDD family protein [Hyphomonas sp.]|uniref:RDD family protein n=1 Tax=Hyphomonas sp. TaxID=87 RepID=UPI00391A6433